MAELCSVADAERRIRDRLPLFPTERVSLDAAAGRMLREVVRAERDQPPFDRVMMDGIAIALGDDGRRRSFAIAGRQPAGASGTALDDPSACIEVATGAVLPRGCDCVVPVEQTRRDGDRIALLETCMPKPRQFIHARGSDCRQGDELLAPGLRLDAPALGVLAANGVAEVEVASLPSIAMVSTGDELVDVEQRAPGDAQVRRSNDRALAAALRGRGYAEVQRVSVRDDRDATVACLGGMLAKHDVLVISGGVSVGRRDFVPEALRALGVDNVLHRIAQKPGKPMWFGVGPQGQIVFALPGNPLSALVCAARHLLPALEHASGLAPRAPERVALAAEANAHPEFTCFVPVRLHHDDAGRADRVVHVPAPDFRDDDVGGGHTRTQRAVQAPRGGAQAACHEERGSEPHAAAAAEDVERDGLVHVR